MALKNGEDSTTVAQFALARGNTLFKSAGTTQKREDFQRAMKFLALAVRIRPSPEANFLVGASALSIGQSAATEAAPAKSCDLTKLADSSLTEAEINLVSGGSAAPDAAKQYLEYITKLRPYVEEELKSVFGARRVGGEADHQKKQKAPRGAGYPTGRVPRAKLQRQAVPRPLSRPSPDLVAPRRAQHVRPRVDDDDDDQPPGP
jgi:hypothetical protein